MMSNETMKESEQSSEEPVPLEFLTRIHEDQYAPGASITFDRIEFVRTNTPGYYRVYITDQEPVLTAIRVARCPTPFTIKRHVDRAVDAARAEENAELEDVGERGFQ